MNWLKTVFFMSLLTVLVVIAGNLIGGQSGMIIAFVIAVAMNFGSYWFSDKIVLTMYRAREIKREDAPFLYDMTENLVQRAQLPMPRLYVVDDNTPNAFATGRNPAHSAVVVTSGITRLLNNQELEGVIAHELSHIKNRDILIGSVAATFAGVITMLANMAQWAMIFGGRDDRDGRLLSSLVLIIVAPLAATLLQLAISRSREFSADATGAHMSGNPEGLASALLKLESGNMKQPVEHAGPATAHMFIVNPLRGGGLMKLFSTHPPTAERVAKLREIAAGRA
ncbi:MAG: zinc metalloprotease HtpX [Ignavibacteriales bacterium]|jgi:Heat shock protein. Metallo peptidase. MEROPS family M48B|nr:MAG: zinc metalloprotease HtpX [Ignavibacteriaceae bacterium]MBW7873712.1 zinc metalloprotease HtpX [Ignavibacteria bacterium]MCZ2143937.1 zinc metalloprotease HtpX [Ignavibacteriales bacterium]OQY72037.1 MAG: protease HtpX [Ignavibacteriales bacterium UTCHB3]MBV6444613.1 Protease HtpX [Ignavibacteriaceae bacterium]